MANDAVRVLVLASETAIASIRLEPLLECLKLRGDIEGYCLLGRDLERLGPDRFATFTHIVAQRNPSSSQFRWLQNSGAPFVYDIDDLLTELPARADKNDDETRSRIAWCLKNAAVVTTANEILSANLVRSTGVDFAGRGTVISNGLWPTAVDPARGQLPAKTLIWTSSDFPMIEQEMPDFPASVAAAADKAGLDIVLVGRFPGPIAKQFRRARFIPQLPFHQFRRLLTLLPAPIGIAPLPTKSDAHQSFIDSKSDVKIVDYQGHGIAALYSRARPYSESDLEPKLLLDNDPALWRENILALAANPGIALDRESAARVHRSRDFARLALLHLGALEVSPRVEIAVPKGSFVPSLRGVERKIRSWRKRR